MIRHVYVIDRVCVNKAFFFGGGRGEGRKGLLKLRTNTFLPCSFDTHSTHELASLEDQEILNFLFILKFLFNIR